MPKFFKNVSLIAGAIAAGVLAMHVSIIEAGGTEPQWFADNYPIILGVCGGIVATAKFTMNGGDDSNSSDK